MSAVDRQALAEKLAREFNGPAFDGSLEAALTGVHSHLTPEQAAEYAADARNEAVREACVWVDAVLDLIGWDA